MPIGELIGLTLIGYGIWFAARGVGMWFGASKEWWRPVDRRKRYPYPAAGITLGICFVLLGARFALTAVLSWAAILGYVGGGLFLVVVAIGVGQPRFLHPPWYRTLEDHLGKKGVARLRAAAFELDTEEWLQVSATDAAFDQWTDQTVPSLRPKSRGYTKGE